MAFLETSVKIYDWFPRFDAFCPFCRLHWHLSGVDPDFFFLMETEAESGEGGCFSNPKA